MYCAQLVKVLADGTLEHINREKNIVGTIEKVGIRMDSMLYKRSTEKK